MRDTARYMPFEFAWLRLWSARFLHEDEEENEDEEEEESEESDDEDSEADEEKEAELIELHSVNFAIDGKLMVEMAELFDNPDVNDIMLRGVTATDERTIKAIEVDEDDENNEEKWFCLTSGQLRMPSWSRQGS